VALEIKMEHVQNGIASEGFEQIRGEIDPLIVSLLVEVFSLLVEPVPASDHSQVDI